MTFFSSNPYDVIIVGGSYAGLSAALALGRARRNVLIIDAGNPCNIQTPHSHNFLTQDGKTPAAISSLAKDQVLRYPTVSFAEGLVSSARKEDDYFVVTTHNGEVFTASKLLIATGVKDIFPEISGLKECWGISVLHCPYCHGYEVSDRKLGVIANGDAALEFVRLLLNWSSKLVLLTNGPSTLSTEQSRTLSGLGIPLLDGPIKSVIHTNGRLSAVALQDHETVSLDAVFARLPFKTQSEFAFDLDCQFTVSGLLSVNEFGQTTSPGVYAAGDSCQRARSISVAVASGTMAGVSINKELIDAVAV